MLNYKIVSTGEFLAVQGCPPSNVQLFDDSEWLVNSVREDNGDRISEIYIELEFDEPSRIETIEIGNAGSALVQVLVWDESAGKYVVFMPTQIMSTPPECIANKNRNKLRTFTKFTAQQAQKPWKRVKIVCKNTFSKLGTPFGLASVRFNSPQDPAASEASQGKSIIASMTSASAGLPIKQFQLQPPTKTAEDNSNGKIGTEAKGEVRFVLETPKLSTESNDVLKKGPGVVSHPRPPPPPPPASPKKEVKKETDEKMGKMGKIEMGKSAGTFYFDDDDEDAADEKSSKKEDSGKGDGIKFMKGVVLAISGIGNPERSKIRSIVLEHGGKYTNDM